MSPTERAVLEAQIAELKFELPAWDKSINRILKSLKEERAAKAEREAKLAELQAQLAAADAIDPWEVAVCASLQAKVDMIAAREAEQRYEPANLVPDPTEYEIEQVGLEAALPLAHPRAGWNRTKHTDASGLSRAKTSPPSGA
jgi:chromosome segregation ATPase